MKKKKDDNHIYLIWSLFCSRDHVKVNYIQSVILSRVNYIKTTEACNLCESLIYMYILKKRYKDLFIIYFYVKNHKHCVLFYFCLLCTIVYYHLRHGLRETRLFSQSKQWHGVRLRKNSRGSIFRTMIELSIKTSLMCLE